MAIKSKAELISYINTNIITNGAQAITGNVLNTFLIDFVDSNLIERTEVFNTGSEVISDLVDAAFFDAGVTDATLPLIADYKERNLVLANNSGFDITIDRIGGDTIEGQVSIVLPDQWILILAPVVALNEWRILSIKKPEYSVLAFEEDNNLQTTISGTATPFEMNINLSADVASPVFIVTGATIEFTSSVPAKFQIVVSYNGDSQTAARDFRCEIYKDFGGGGEVKLAGVGKGIMDNGSYGSFGFVTQTTLTQGDVLTMTTSNDENNSNITIVDSMISIVEIL